MGKSKAKILVVDDNAGIRSALKILLPMHFAQVELIASPKELHARMVAFRPDVVLLDMNFEDAFNSGNEGLFYLSEIKREFPDTAVVLFTAYADVGLAVEGMKRGATDFIVKPWENDKLVETLRAASSVSLRGRTGEGVKGLASADSPASRTAGSEATGEEGSGMRWGDSPAMLAVRKLVGRIAPTDASVLITGENGTGKDLLATEIYQHSGRAGKPFVCVDMGAITETLFESELFGHVKGAFTDAKNDHEGKFEQASGGTVFLDEIGNIPLHLQAKLLRVLQNRSITRVGGNKEIPIDIRLICATNMNLRKMISEGQFREDLYYRINAAEIHLPSLRERSDEILPLARRFLAEFSGKYSRQARDFSPEACESLMNWPWKGNIRELRNVVQKAVIVSDGEIIGADELGLESGAHAGGSSRDSMGSDVGVQTLDQAEERAIREAMRSCEGNLTMVAKMLNISRPTLYSKLKKYNL